jgi:tRNA(fMet)-specific endonuclease VapC
LRSEQIASDGADWTGKMLLDTSFLIDLMDGRPEAVALAAAIDREGGRLRLPAPVLFELWVGASQSNRKGDELTRIEQLVTAYEIVGFDGDDARAAGSLQSTLSRSGKGLGTIDVQLAGMALARSEELVTGDKVLARVGHRVPIRTYRLE